MTERTEAEAALSRMAATVVTVLEDKADLSTREVVTGLARISTRTEAVADVARAILQDQSVEVARVALGTIVDSAPVVRTGGDIIIPVLEERLPVEKRLVLTEESHVERRTIETVVETPVTLRRRRAVVERYDEAGYFINEEDHS